MVKETELYSRLEVNANSTQTEIQNKYWSIVKTLQPAETEDIIKLREITEAYNVLKDPLLRRKYDVEGINGVQQLGITENLCCFSNFRKRLQYFCYDISHTSQMSPSERLPLISKGINKEHGCCFKFFVWISAIFLFFFFIATLTYLIFLED